MGKREGSSTPFVAIYTKDVAEAKATSATDAAIDLHELP